MLKRVGQHKSQLRRGEHDLPRLQKDWGLYGEESFGFDLYLYSVSEMRAVESHFIVEFGSLEHQNGYNKMVGGKWGPEARIRNTEDKLRKKGKYYLLRGYDREAPIFSDFIRTFNHHN